MRLYLIRHGKADRDSPSGRDDDRPLKPRGVRQAHFLAQALADSDAPPTLILSSPILRAIDTARILHERLRCPLEVFDHLSTSAGPANVLTLIRLHAAAGSLALVGHNPTLSEVAASLVNPAPGELRTGEAFALDFTPPPPPRLARFLHAMRDDDDD